MFLSILSQSDRTLNKKTLKSVRPKTYPHFNLKKRREQNYKKNLIFVFAGFKSKTAPDIFGKRLFIYF